MWIYSITYPTLFIIVLTGSYDTANCDAISNTNFNSLIRDYTTHDSDGFNNITHVKTLQKEEIGRYVPNVPAGTPIKFKEIPDSALSSSSNGRGLQYHDEPGYTLNDYEAGGPYYNFGHEYHLHDARPEDHGPHDYNHGHYYHHDHHIPHEYGYHHYDGHHQLDHGHHNKHYKHALAAKTVLWPIAGIALLGAAAALVSNPVLLQLGVISGKRRRRDTEKITGPEFTFNTFTKYADKIKKLNVLEINHQNESSRKKTNVSDILKFDDLNEYLRRRVLRTGNPTNIKHNAGVIKKHSSVQSNIDQVTTNPGHYDTKNYDDKYIPIPIILRSPKGFE